MNYNSYKKLDRFKKKNFDQLFSELSTSEKEELLEKTKTLTSDLVPGGVYAFASDYRLEKLTTAQGSLDYIVFQNQNLPIPNFFLPKVPYPTTLKSLKEVLSAIMFGTPRVYTGTSTIEVLDKNDENNDPWSASIARQLRSKVGTWDSEFYNIDLGTFADPDGARVIYIPECSRKNKEYLPIVQGKNLATVKKIIKKSLILE